MAETAAISELWQNNIWCAGFAEIPSRNDTPDVVPPWVVPPSFAVDCDLDSIFASSRDTQAMAILDECRGVYADLLALAVDRGWVAEEEIESAFSSTMPNLALYNLVSKSLDGGCAWMRGLAEQAKGSACESNYQSFGLAVRECHACNQPPHSALLVVGDGAWYHDLGDFSGVPLTVAATAHRLLLSLAMNYLDITTPEEAMDQDYILQEEVAIYDEIVKKGVSDDPGKILKMISDSEFAYEREIYTTEQAVKWLGEVSAIREKRPWEIRPEGSPVEEAERALREQAGWRKTDRALYADRWSRWIRRAALAMKRLERGRVKHSVCDVSDNEVLLGYVNYLSMGHKWVENVVSQTGNSLGDSGEEPILSLDMSPRAQKGLLWKLEALAVGNGLLQGAIDISDPQA